MAKQERDPARERHWRAVMADWEASGTSVREFCRRRQLAEPSFYAWRCELRKRDAKPAPRSASPTFVPVTVLPAATIEVRCPSGHVVSLPHADAATLRNLFAALAPVPPC
jgi:hypothetical protein